MHWLLFFQMKVSTSRRVVLNELCAGDSVSSNVERMTRERPPGLHSPSYVVKPAITISIHYNHLAFQWGFVVLVEPWGALVQQPGASATPTSRDSAPAGGTLSVLCDLRRQRQGAESSCEPKDSPLQVFWELRLRESYFIPVKVPLWLIYKFITPLCTFWKTVNIFL